MNNTQRTRRAPRAVEAILGAHRARKRTQFVRIMAAQLDLIAPGTVRVVVAPLTIEDRTRTWVELIDADGRTITADREAHRAAHGLLRRAFPLADWRAPRVYDARTGTLAVHHLTAPDEIGFNASGEARP